uniref:ARF like GTPase 15 n=1 Tax=Callithrix jacchus TaxID=9483 RepID=A0A8I4A6G0_CALJA
MGYSFSTIWKCFRALCCKGPPPARPEYDLVCIGLTGSGKTSLLSKLCSESPENVVSTTGADNIRKYWSRYYQGSQGVIFVLDSASSEDDLEAARNELHSALQHPQLCTLPFLILANHQDKPAARSVQEVLWRRLQIQTASGSHPQCSRSVTRYLLLGEYKRHRGLKVKYSLSLEFGDLMSSPISATSCGRVT